MTGKDNENCTSEASPDVKARLGELADEWLREHRSWSAATQPADRKSLVRLLLLARTT